MWEYLALADPNLALSYYYSDTSYEPFDGESRAHTMHWLYNLKKMGHVDTTISADIPTYSVFKTQGGDLTYISYNAGSEDRLVTFSDGFSMTVAPKELKSVSTENENPDAPVALLLSNKTSGKSPLTVEFSGSKSFDRNESPLTFLWDFDDGITSTAADTSHVFTDVKTYNVILTVTNDQLISTKDSVEITVLGNGTPYLGTPVTVPGTIEAENYDLGGEGVAYHDADANNLGLAYRPDEGVDLEPSSDIGGGFNIGWIEEGEWVEYTIDVAHEGMYKIIPQTASVPGGGQLHIEFNGIDKTGKVDVPVTGGWQFWLDLDIPEVQLNAGKQVMHVAFYNGQFNLNKIKIEASTTTLSEEQKVPGRFYLKQNYPNPFNPETSIRFGLPQATNVRIELYNILGAKVATIIDDYRAAGYHIVRFDGSNLASGIYIYRIVAGNFQQEKKMILLR